MYAYVHVWTSEDNLGYWPSGIVPPTVGAKKTVCFALKSKLNKMKLS